MRDLVCCTKLKGKAQDFRTSTGVGHEFTPPISEYYEHNRRQIPLDLTNRDARLVGDNYVTNYAKEHGWKERDGTEIPQLPMSSQRICTMRNFQSKCAKKPTYPVGIGACGNTEYKEEYPQKIPYIPCAMKPIEPAYICKSMGLGRDEQPPIGAETSGVLKLLDPYVSTYQMAYIPFTREHQMGVAKKDIDTFYDIAGVPKCKGFGPKHSDFTGPLLSIRLDPVYDVVQFPKMAKHRAVPKLARRVPYVGMESEKQAKYKPPIDEFSSHIFDTGVQFNQAYPRASPWENLCAPYMYCTDYCHIGSSNFPVRAVVDPGKNKKNTKNMMCCIWHPGDCEH